MSTTITLDDELLGMAQRLTGLTEITTVVMFGGCAAPHEPEPTFDRRTPPRHMTLPLATLKHFGAQDYFA